jgi:hypothetical protein
MMIYKEELRMVERPLMNLEQEVINKKIGLARTRFAVCALSPENSGIEYDNIDCIHFSLSRKQARKLKKKMEKEFPRDEVRILLIEVKRIE